MKKILTTIIICMILIITLVSALELQESDWKWDNKEAFVIEEGNYGTYHIKDSILGLWTTSKVKDITLESNTFKCSNNCEAIKTITNYKETSLVDDIRFYRLYEDGSRELSNIRSYEFLIKTGETPYEIDDYESQCSEKQNINGSIGETCIQVKTGSHTEYNKQWETYPLGTVMPIGTYEIKLIGEKKSDWSYDWQIRSSGIWSENWAIWGDLGSLNLNLTDYWKFDEGVGTNAEGNIDSNNITLNSAWILGIIGNATDMQLTSGDSIGAVGISGTSNRTLSVWVNPNANKDQAFAGWGGCVNNGLFIIGAASNGNIHFYGHTAGDFSTVENLPLDTWTHLVAQFDGTKVIYWKNGFNFINSTESLDTTDSDFTIGEVSCIASTFDANASVDEIGIWNRLLTGNEILELYNSGVGITYPFNEGIITLNFPEDNFISSTNDIQFNATATLTGGSTLVNATTNLYNLDGSLNQSNSTLGLSGTTNSLNHSFTLGDATYKWERVYCDSDGDCGFSENRTVGVNTQAPIIVINNPTGVLDSAEILKSETLNTTITDGTLDTCWFEYNVTNTTFACVSGITNTTTFLLTNQKNITVYANDSVGNTDSEFSSWDYTIFTNSITFNAQTTEGSSEDFSANITLADGESISSAFLNYNGTMDASEITTFSTSIILDNQLDVPNLDQDANVTFFWEVTLVSGEVNTSSNNQSILSLGLDNCTEFGVLILNYTLRDEETQLFLDGDGQNTTMEIDVTVSTLANNIEVIKFSQDYNQTNPAQVCMKNDTLNNSQFRMDVQTRYESKDRVSEFHNIQNFTLTNSSVPQNINLFDLKSTDAQVFKIIFKDKNFLPVESALIDIQRKYIAEGVFKSVEIPLTDRDGTTVTNLVLNEVIYTIIVSKEGTILGTFDNRIAICDNLLTGDCLISLNELTEGQNIEDFETFGGLSFLPSINQDTRTIRIIFTTADGSSSNVKVNTTKADNLGTTQVCIDSLVSSTGTLSCTIPESVGNVTVTSVLTADGEPIRTFQFTLVQDPQEVFGGSGLMMALVFVMAMPFLFITDPRGIIIGSIMGLIVVAMLGLYVSGAFLAIGSSVLWLVVVGAIGIYKISEREK